MSRHYFSIILCCIVVTIFTTISVISNNWNWFARSGALLVIIAIVTEYLPTLKTKKADEMLAWTNQDDHNATRVAATLVVAGTLIWGFGDLVGEL